MTSPAAVVPVLPLSRIRREDEMLRARRNRVSSSRVVGKAREFHRPHQVQRDHQHGDRYQDIGDDQEIQEEAGQRSDQRHHDDQHGHRDGHLAEQRPAADWLAMGVSRQGWGALWRGS